MTTTESPPQEETRRSPLLSEILGIERGVRQKANDKLGALQKQLRALPQMTGIDRVYRPTREDDPEQLPREYTRVQVRVDDILGKVRDVMADLADVVLTRDVGNTQAVADIVVGDVAIATNVPVTNLQFLEKQLDDLLTILKTAPVLDPSEDWSWDPTTSSYRSGERATTRTKKLPVSFIKAPATDKHPAQVEVLMEDRVVGVWTRIAYSGALPADRLFQLVQRCEALQRAVKQARERANSRRVERQQIGDAMFNYLLAP